VNYCLLLRLRLYTGPVGGPARHVAPLLKPLPINVYGVVFDKSKAHLTIETKYNRVNRKTMSKDLRAYQKMEEDNIMPKP
jgi:hypothetical protein